MLYLSRSIWPTIQLAEKADGLVIYGPELIRSGLSFGHIISGPELIWSWLAGPQLIWSWLAGPELIWSWLAGPQLIWSWLAGPQLIWSGFSIGFLGQLYCWPNTSWQIKYGANTFLVKYVRCKSFLNQVLSRPSSLRPPTTTQTNLPRTNNFQTYCVSDHILPRPGSDNPPLEILGHPVTNLHVSPVCQGCCFWRNFDEKKQKYILLRNIWRKWPELEMCQLSRKRCITTNFLRSFGGIAKMLGESIHRRTL